MAMNKFFKLLAHFLFALYFTWQSTVPDSSNWVDIMMAVSFTALMLLDLFLDFEKN
jgi:hypothetical protein